MLTSESKDQWMKRAIELEASAYRTNIFCLHLRYNYLYYPTFLTSESKSETTAKIVIEWYKDMFELEGASEQTRIF